MGDGRRCVDKGTLWEDSSFTVFLFLAGYVLHVIGAPVYVYVGNYLVNNGARGELITYTYKFSLLPTWSIESVLSVCMGFFAFILFVCFIVILGGSLDRYYPSCSDLKKREKKRGAE